MNTAALAGLLEAIIREPESDDLRLIYADALALNGEEEHGEFVRVQIELGRLHPDVLAACRAVCQPPLFEGCPNQRLRRRERELLDAHFVEWTPVIEGEEGGYLLSSAPVVRVRTSEDWDSDIALTFHRGFVEEVTLPVRCWLAHGPGLVRAAPLLRVTFSDCRVIAATPDSFYLAVQSDAAASLRTFLEISDPWSDRDTGERVLSEKALAWARSQG